eukprot:766264-Hanusia_phi.AAC.1
MQQSCTSVDHPHPSRPWWKGYMNHPCYPLKVYGQAGVGCRVQGPRTRGLCGDPVFHRLRARLFRSYRARLGLATLFAGAARYATFSGRSPIAARSAPRFRVGAERLLSGCRSASTRFP